MYKRLLFMVMGLFILTEAILHVPLYGLVGLHVNLNHLHTTMAIISAMLLSEMITKWKIYTNIVLNIFIFLVAAGTLAYSVYYIRTYYYMNEFKLRISARMK